MLLYGEDRDTFIGVQEEEQRFRLRLDFMREIRSHSNLNWKEVSVVINVFFNPSYRRLYYNIHGMWRISRVDGDKNVKVDNLEDEIKFLEEN